MTTVLNHVPVEIIIARTNWKILRFISAFEMLLINLPDLILDTPDAPTVLGNYLARAVADVCMPPNVMKVLKDKVDNQHAR